MTEAGGRGEPLGAEQFFDEYPLPLRVRDDLHKRQIIIFAEAYAEAREAAQHAPLGQTCPTCGTDLRCIHGKLFSETCEPCEAPEPRREEGKG